MKKLLCLFVSVAVLSAAVIGCKTSADSESEKTVDLVVQNNGTKSITAVYIDTYSTNISSPHGDNMISTAIAPNARAHIALAAGDYSFRCVYDGEAAGSLCGWKDPANQANQRMFSFKDNSMPTITLSGFTLSGVYYLSAVLTDAE